MRLLLVALLAVSMTTPVSANLHRFEPAASLTGDSITGTWTSEWVDPGIPAVRLIASWNADTPGDSSIEVDLQAMTAAGTGTRWYTMGNWTFGDGRTSVNGQSDADGKVETDTLVAVGEPFTGYR